MIVPLLRLKRRGLPKPFRYPAPRPLDRRRGGRARSSPGAPLAAGILSGVALRSALTEASQNTARNRMTALSGLVEGGAAPSVIQSAIGLAQLEIVDELVHARRKNAQQYNTLLKDTAGLILPPEKEERPDKNLNFQSLEYSFLAFHEPEGI